MTTNVKKRSKPVPKSGRPYKRRSEAEMFKIRQVLRLYASGKEKKYISQSTGVARNTVKKYLLRFISPPLMG
jgi:DNA-binding NarL/FixJ family response regulator